MELLDSATVAFTPHLSDAEGDAGRDGDTLCGRELYRSILISEIHP
jgi:hypothetical protein